jgi:hypothetical protein
MAGRISPEALGAEQGSERIECGCHVDVEVGVDTTGHTPQLLRWSWPSLPSLGIRGGTAVPDRSDGRSRLFVATGPLTPTRRRDVPLSPNLLRATTAAVDTTEHCHCCGAYVPVASSMSF